jgi:flagellar protein FliS
MFGSMKSGASAYAKVGIETGVMAASPHKLIVMLYDGALTAIRNAQVHMKAGNIPEKGSQVSKAIKIIENGLRASLDREVGGEIAQGLDSLYEYMGHRLLMANLNNQPELLEEVHCLLSDLRDAWNAIGNVALAPVEATPAPVLASA